MTKDEFEALAREVAMLVPPGTKAAFLVYDASTGDHHVASNGDPEVVRAVVDHWEEKVRAAGGREKVPGAVVVRLPKKDSN